MNIVDIYNNQDSIIRFIPKNTQFLLLGESTHGTREFYEIRSKITQELVEYNDFNIIFFETDWLNVIHINQYIQSDTSSFDTASETLDNINKFPEWMWKNDIIIELIEWLKVHNQKMEKKIYVLGMDCYLLVESYHYIIGFLENMDIELCNKIKKDLHFLNSYDNTQKFMHFVVHHPDQSLVSFYENYFQHILITIQNKYDTYFEFCKEKNIDTLYLITLEQSAEVMINSFEYFKKQYSEPPGSNVSWNTRDQHMLMTLMKLNEKIPNSKMIIWAHNSHISDSTATNNSSQEFTKNDTWNLGQMSRAILPNTYIIGFGTYQGTVTAASKWGNKHEQFVLQLPIKDSIEYYIYKLAQERNMTNCVINLRKKNDLIEFNQYTKQRMIGVIYNFNNELQSHYISSIFSNHYDLYIFISYTHALIS